MQFPLPVRRLLESMRNNRREASARHVLIQSIVSNSTTMMPTLKWFDKRCALGNASSDELITFALLLAIRCSQLAQVTSKGGKFADVYRRATSTFISKNRQLVHGLVLAFSCDTRSIVRWVQLSKAEKTGNPFFDFFSRFDCAAADVFTLTECVTSPGNATALFAAYRESIRKHGSILLQESTLASPLNRVGRGRAVALKPVNFRSINDIVAAQALSGLCQSVMAPQGL